jgi:orotate phosphoribosyltransferase
MNSRDQLRALLRRKSLFRGKFTLSSGQSSDYYLDCRLTTLDPEGAVLTAHTILELLAEHGIEAEAIGGPTIGADPIVTAVAAISFLEGKPLPAFLVRKEQKGHGRQKRIEGFEPRKGMKVVIVDDVCTSGGSTLDALAAAEEAGLNVVAVLSLVDREEGGSAKIKEKYPYHAVFTARELLQDKGTVGSASERTEETSLRRPT